MYRVLPILMACHVFLISELLRFPISLFSGCPNKPIASYSVRGNEEGKLEPLACLEGAKEILWPQRIEESPLQILLWKECRIIASTPSATGLSLEQILESPPQTSSGRSRGEYSKLFLWKQQTNNSQLLSWQKNSPHSLCRTCRESPNTLAEGNAGKSWPRCPPVFIPRNALKTSWPRSILPSKHLLLLQWLLLVPFWSGLVLLSILC